MIRGGQNDTVSYDMYNKVVNVYSLSQTSFQTHQGYIGWT